MLILEKKINVGRVSISKTKLAVNGGVLSMPSNSRIKRIGGSVAHARGVRGREPRRKRIGIRGQ